MEHILNHEGLKKKRKGDFLKRPKRERAELWLTEK